MRGFASTGVATGAEEVTASDTVDLTTISRAIYTESGGDIKVKMANDVEVTIPGVPAGAILPIAVKRVFSTGTANTTGIVSFF